MLFLVDENLPVDLAALIRSQGHRAIAVVETDRCGLKDAEIWDWAAREGAVLVTLDLDFPLRERRPAPQAVVLLRPRGQAPSAILALWSEFAVTAHFGRLRGKVVSVRPGRARSRTMP